MTQPLDLTQFDGHTPGEWRAVRDPCHFDTLSEVVGGEAKKIRGISSRLLVSVGGFADVKEQEANTRLLAAAPALLREVRELRAKVAELEGER